MLKGVNCQKLDEIFKLSFLKPAKDIVVSNLEGLDNYDPRASNFLRFAKGEYIEFCLQSGIITDAYLVGKIEEGIKRAALSDYELLMKGVVSWPDHVMRPEVFAYAFENKLLSKMKIRKLKFDHGEDVKSYCESERVDNLVSVLKEELLTPGKKEDVHDDYEEAAWAIQRFDSAGKSNMPFMTKYFEGRDILNEKFPAKDITAGFIKNGRRTMTIEEQKEWMEEARRIRLP